MSCKIIYVCDRCGKSIEDDYYDCVRIVAKWDDKEDVYHSSELKLDFCKECFNKLQEHNWFVNF